MSYDPGAPVQQAYQPPPPLGPRTNPWFVALIVLGVLLAITVAVLTVLLVVRDDGTRTATDVVPTPAAVETPAPATPAPTATPITPPSVQQPVYGSVPERGLFCRDLKSRGYTYAEAVGYWISEGRPDRMDADVNGIPCETVYPREDVVAYWGYYPFALEPGLYCRDLKARGYSYAEAVWYWADEGYPARMDEDVDGIPCETVYPVWEIQDYWGPVPVG